MTTLLDNTRPKSVISTKTSALPTPNPVISTEAAHTVSCAVERPPHFAFAVAVAPRYPKGLSFATRKRGFSPWGMPSLQQAPA